MAMQVYTSDANGKWVFPDIAYRQNLGWTGPDELDEIPNPDYDDRLFLEMGMSNSHVVMEALGVPIENGMFECGIDEMLGRIDSWTRRNFGKTSAEIEPTVTDEDGRMYWFNGGMRAGYVNEKIWRMRVLCQMSKERGATRIYGA